MSWVMKHSRSKLGARLVAMVLADHADTYGCSSYPSVSTIADEANLSVRQVHRALGELQDLGEILRVGVHANPHGGKPVTVWDFPAVSGKQYDKLTHCESDKLADCNMTNPTHQCDISARSNMTNRAFLLKDEPSIKNHPLTINSSDSDSGKKKKCATGDERFDDFWSAYPKRSGGNSKQAALQRFVSRVKHDGIDPDVIITSVKAYADYCDATGKTGSEYVMHAETFLSPTKRGWEQDWSIPEASGKNGQPAKTLKERSAEISRRMAERGL